MGYFWEGTFAVDQGYGLTENQCRGSYPHLYPVSSTPASLAGYATEAFESATHFSGEHIPESGRAERERHNVANPFFLSQNPVPFLMGGIPNKGKPEAIHQGGKSKCSTL